MTGCDSSACGRFVHAARRQAKQSPSQRSALTGKRSRTWRGAESNGRTNSGRGEAVKRLFRDEDARPSQATSSHDFDDLVAKSSSFAVSTFPAADRLNLLGVQKRVVDGNRSVQGTELKVQAGHPLARRSSSQFEFSHAPAQLFENRLRLGQLGQGSGALLREPLQRGRSLHCGRSSR